MWIISSVHWILFSFSEQHVSTASLTTANQTSSHSQKNNVTSNNTVVTLLLQYCSANHSIIDITTCTINTPTINGRIHHHSIIYMDALFEWIYYIVWVYILVTTLNLHSLTVEQWFRPRVAGSTPAVGISFIFSS